MEAPDPNAVEPTRTPSNRGSSADGEENPYAYGSDKWLTWKLKRNGGSLRAGMRFNESNKRVAEGVQPVLNVTGDVCLSVATGPFRDIIEIGTGKDMWDDRELTRTEIGVRVGLTFGVPIAGIFLAKAFSVGSKVARAVHRAEQAGETVEEVLESGVRIADRAENVGETVKDAIQPGMRVADFTESASRIPGAQWKNFDQLRAYLARQTHFSDEGVGLIKSGDSILDGMGSGKNAAFVMRNGRPWIVLRSGATNREVLHELGHMLTHKQLGHKVYYTLSERAREHLASTFVRSRGSYTKNTPDEVWQELKAIDPNFVPTDAIRDLLRQWGALLE